LLLPGPGKKLTPFGRKGKREQVKRKKGRGEIRRGQKSEEQRLCAFIGIKRKEKGTLKVLGDSNEWGQSLPQLNSLRKEGKKKELLKKTKRLSTHHGGRENVAGPKKGDKEDGIRFNFPFGYQR